MSARMPYPHERDEILRTIPESAREAVKLIFDEFERCERALCGKSIEEFVFDYTFDANNYDCGHDEDEAKDEGVSEGRKEMREEAIEAVEAGVDKPAILEAVRALKV